MLGDAVDLREIMDQIGQLDERAVELVIRPRQPVVVGRGPLHVELSFRSAHCPRGAHLQLFGRAMPAAWRARQPPVSATAAIAGAAG